MSDKKFLLITKKELFYSAVMLRIRKLVNVVYDFPADDSKFQRELKDARKTLWRKGLLEISSSGEDNISFVLSVCVSFCANPDSCEVVDSYGYRASVYRASSMYMLMENREDDTEELLAVAWFADKNNLDSYINSQIDTRKGALLR